MRNISELLREADPLRFEPLVPPASRGLREAVLAAASEISAPAEVRSRSRVVLLAAVAFTATAVFVGPHLWPRFVGDVHAATIRFEVRLAEDRPGPGLHEIKVPNSNRSVYLHDEAIVTNSDIATARAIPDTPSEYSVSVEFNRDGAAKIRAATAGRVGKLLAILLDGQVVMAPTLRTPIAGTARITGHFTQAQAVRIAEGIQGR